MHEPKAILKGISYDLHNCRTNRPRSAVSRTIITIRSRFFYHENRRKVFKNPTRTLTRDFPSTQRLQYYKHETCKTLRARARQYYRTRCDTYDDGGRVGSSDGRRRVPTSGDDQKFSTPNNVVAAARSLRACAHRPLRVYGDGTLSITARRNHDIMDRVRSGGRGERSRRRRRGLE